MRRPIPVERLQGLESDGGRDLTEPEVEQRQHYGGNDRRSGQHGAGYALRRAIGEGCQLLRNLQLIHPTARPVGCSPG